MAKQIYVDENGNPIEVSGTVNNASMLPISGNDSTDTKTYIDTGLSGKADKSGFIVTDTFSASNLSITNNTDYVKTFDVTKTGYTPLGVVQIVTSGNYCTRIHFSKYQITGNTLSVEYRANAESFSASNVYIGFVVLYVKNA